MKLSRKLALTLRVASTIALGTVLVPILAAPAQAQPDPTATISSPATGGTYYVGQVVATTFSCTEGTGGPGLASCDDNNGTNTASGGSGTLDTSSPGHFTYTVTATSNDTETGPASITYTVADLPTATISSPATGGTYYVGQVVATTFSCTEGTGGPGLASCDDNNGTNTASGGSGTLDTSSPGHFTYTVTATSNDTGTGPASITYTVADLPTATISSPVTGGTYYVGQVVATTFSCTEGTGGPGLASCDDNNGTNTASGGSGTLDTSSPGHFTYTVTATSNDTETGPASITYTVADLPTATISSPATGGTYYVGQVVATTFSCTEGTGGPGLASCDDNNGTNTASGGSGTLDTSSPGHFTYTVTATSNDTETGPASITYTVVTPPPPPPTTITQTAPFSNSTTLIKSASFTDTLTTTGNTGAVTFAITSAPPGSAGGIRVSSTRCRHDDGRTLRGNLQSLGHRLG